ncbi:hypothetical protein VTL71DRAFT_16504 [Oculimacula yallundae]|uniref:Uncharacterized protein n=1 Tax=Oculimacula yallundae TaxID=86028 RepID=A0ABR4CFX5_9HELO
MSVYSESLRRRNRPFEIPRSYPDEFYSSDEEIEEAIEVIEVIEVELPSQDAKIQAVIFLEDVITLLRVPFALVASSLLVDGFDFASKHVEIQRLAVRMVELIPQIHDQYQTFDGVIFSLTAGDIPFESFHTGSLKAVRATRESTGAWVNDIRFSLSWIIEQYQIALYRLQELKSKHSMSAGQIELGAIYSLEKAQYNRTLSELQEGLSIVQHKLFERAASALQSLTAMEDSIELALQIATGNMKILKREKLGEERYWAWRLRALKAKTKYNSKSHQLEWDSMMASCAEFSSIIRKAKNAIAESYLIMLDAQKSLDALMDEQADNVDIWATAEGRDGSRVDYFLSTFREELMSLEEVSLEVREEKSRLREARQVYLDSL